MSEEVQVKYSDLGSRHRDAMLDLVLVWASIDGALSMLLANVRSQRWTDAANEIRKLRGSAKLAEVIKAIKALNDGDEAAKKLRQIKKRYERYSLLRDHIAHSKCVGVDRSRPESIVFLTFERVNAEELAVYEVPVGDFEEATKWGNDFVELLFHWTRNREE